MMDPADEIISSDLYNSRRRRRNYLIGGAVAVVLLVIIISVSVTSTRNRPSATISPSEIEELRSMIKTAMEKEGLDPTVLDDPGTYQSSSFDWLITNVEVRDFDRSQILQRYSLGCLYYATYRIASIYSPNPQGWKNAQGWMTNEHECGWQGMSCNEGLKANGINLEQNGLTGKIPPEIVLIREHLEFLDLTTNELYMKESDGDFDFFDKMSDLRTLLLDDNYLESDDGIPKNFASMVSIEKIRLSYNLFAGQLDDYLFTQWTKLTHLEMESNFLTGTLPLVVGELTDLVYLYIRRNSLEINLDFIKTGKLANLFAMWLDSNKLGGTIPTEIGQLTYLASLSMTNSSLTGTIPTEIGLLTDLQRIWLYGNQLTGPVPAQLGQLDKLEVLELQRNNLAGTMPNDICIRVNAATYSHKSLAADCDSVVCDDCCTYCE